jgi:CheY-like chemotaxis protein
MRILIAEDNSVTRTRLREILQTQPTWEVQEALDGKAAWDVLEHGTFAPQLLIADFQMPGWGAVPLVRRLRSEDRFKHLSVLIAGSVRDRFDLEREKDLPIEGRLLKPFHGARVLDEVLRYAAEIERREEEERKRLEEEARQRREREEEEARIAAEKLRLEQEEQARIEEERRKREELLAKEEKTRQEIAEQRARLEQAERDVEEALKREERLKREVEENRLREEEEKARQPLVNPMEIMEQLGIGPREYVSLLDSMLESLSSGVEELRGLLLSNHMVVARQRLQDMKRSCMNVGASAFVRAIEEHLLSELGIDKVKTLEHFDNELRRLKEARAAIQLIGQNQPQDRDAVLSEKIIAPAQIAPAPQHTNKEVVSVEEEFPSANPLNASATSQDEINPTPDLEPTEESGLSSLSSFEEEIMPANPPKIEELLPVAAKTQLEQIIASAQAQGYEVSPAQAIRALIKAVDPASIPVMEFYNILMEDYEAAQGK